MEAEGDMHVCSCCVAPIMLFASISTLKAALPSLQKQREKGCCMRRGNALIRSRSMKKSV